LIGRCQCLFAGNEERGFPEEDKTVKSHDISPKKTRSRSRNFHQRAKKASHTLRKFQDWKSFHFIEVELIIECHLLDLREGIITPKQILQRSVGGITVAIRFRQFLSIFAVAAWSPDSGVALLDVHFVVPERFCGFFPWIEPNGCSIVVGKAHLKCHGGEVRRKRR
jgi:hypothetical protein